MTEDRVYGIVERFGLELLCVDGDDGEVDEGEVVPTACMGTGAPLIAEALAVALAGVVSALVIEKWPDESILRCVASELSRIKSRPSHALSMLILFCVSSCDCNLVRLSSGLTCCGICRLPLPREFLALKSARYSIYSLCMFVNLYSAISVVYLSFAIDAWVSKGALSSGDRFCQFSPTRFAISVNDRLNGLNSPLIPTIFCLWLWRPESAHLLLEKMT